MADAPRLVVLLAAVACHGSSHGTPIDAPPDTAVDAPPDAPGAQAPDLRFKWVVGAPSTLEYNTNSENVLDLAFPGGVTLSYGEFTFAPLGMQVNDLGSAPSAAWFLTDFTAHGGVEPITGRAFSSTLDSLDDDLATDLSEANAGVVTSFDVIPSLPGSGGFAYAVEGVMNGPTYPVVSSDIASGALADFVASEGSAGRVVTALSASPNAPMLRVYSHAREGDATTFTTAVVDTTAEQFVAATTALAGSGYVITAVGHVADDAIVLVGTRSAGMPASFTTTQQTSILGPMGSAAGAMVGWVFAVDGSGGSDDLNEIVFEQ